MIQRVVPNSRGIQPTFTIIERFRGVTVYELFVVRRSECSPSSDIKACNYNYLPALLQPQPVTLAISPTHFLRATMLLVPTMFPRWTMATIPEVLIFP